ncbi:ras association domain-containing protein 8-like [Carcharodon carcharias]|uniref:ras association domain-containing protein 8-like n=1 Tax=Carcharodon carcharias TaxID=13397 RepID=UPI001B7DD70D|nr:ras association domain-containing protein 8-like [Carcharodon carcharias]XP_041052437.1 ras association domain-containing protein 8-like [Carcharodon carcharias]XP_041052438.1 ras association domain-containing protein 8-like [Carcharodon carcharias]XP_041052439.1 ras association domain-containing protein 8-like [Carcharodon carcharias]XP_041052440.1 ras association domain-containing protein 8-like [Carcharodon carcharias]XP_041052441.1 ras association domain-containing protein 8-like [Carch
MPGTSCTVMELKVWVDGVQRVVCGVSEETTCQEVVIALAQAIGQTGRYVLIQKLRDSERQLLANESPLQLLAKCGQYANDVRFLLRRTGSTHSERPVSGNAAQSLEPSLSRTALLPAKPTNPELPKRREPKKSLTFTGGSLGAPDLALQNKWRGKKLNGAEGQGNVSKPPASKEDLFKLILIQQEKLSSVSAQHESFDCQIKSWEQPGVPNFEKQLVQLEQAIRRNEEELEEEQFWERELQLENERERELQRHLSKLKQSFRENMQRLHEISSRTELLDREILQEEGDRARRLKASHRASHTGTREAIDRVRAEIEAKTQQNQQIQTSIIDVGRTLEETDRRLQAKTQELEELNKELRQCNLQQFIQQTGSGGTQARNEEESTTDESNQQQLSTHWNGDIHTSEIDSPPRQTAKQFLGNPRNLQNPLVSSLNPEEFHHWIVGS